MKELSLVIPCYNEAKNLPLLVKRCREAFTDPAHEIVLVDNGSTDDTPAVLPGLLAGQFIVRSVRVEENQGYGFGILSGLKAAEGGILAWTHADMQTDPADALRGLDIFRADGDRKLFVKGRRYGRPLGDIAFTAGMSLFETALFLRPMWDINAQPTMFPRALFESWKTPPFDFSLDLFAYHSALAADYAVKRFPVLFGERAHGNSHWNVNWRAKAKFVKRTLSYSLALRFGGAGTP